MLYLFNLLGPQIVSDYIHLYIEPPSKLKAKFLAEDTEYLPTYVIQAFNKGLTPTKRGSLLLIMKNFQWGSSHEPFRLFYELVDEEVYIERRRLNYPNIGKYNTSEYTTSNVMELLKQANHERSFTYGLNRIIIPPRHFLKVYLILNKNIPDRFDISLELEFTDTQKNFQLATSKISIGLIINLFTHILVGGTIELKPKKISEWIWLLLITILLIVLLGAARLGLKLWARRREIMFSREFLETSKQNDLIKLTK